MKVEALNCPNCGAGVASDRTQCEFCKTRLKTVACPTCFGMMFVGAKFCGHCGAIAAPIEVIIEDNAGVCPRCRVSLERMRVSETLIQGCPKCDGLWVDPTTFEIICSNGERQSAVLGFLAERTTKTQQMTKVSYVPCPDCRQLMNRNNFAKASGVIVDICKHHGVWFDVDELPSIVEFIQKGGLEIVRHREKLEILNEREKLRDARRQLSALDARGVSGISFSNRDESGIHTFVRNLFS